MLEKTAKRILREALGAAYQILVLSGTATDGSGTTLVDTTQAWPIDEYAADEVRFTIDAVDYRRAITSNAATELTFPALPTGVEVSAGLAYEIWRYVGILNLSGQTSALLDSTTTPLGDGLTYTGASKECDKYARIVGSIFTDHASTLYIDQSQDNTNWDYSSDFAVTANTGLAFSVEVVAPYCRLRVVNSAGAAQTVLRAYMRGRVI